MRPGVLDDLGLVAAIEWLAADFEKRTGLACMATLPATDIALDLGLAVVLFRIVQEALTNVIRHAKATARRDPLARDRGRAHYGGRGQRPRDHAAAGRGPEVAGPVQHARTRRCVGLHGGFSERSRPGYHRERTGAGRG